MCGGGGGGGWMSTLFFPINYEISFTKVTEKYGH